MAGGNQNQASGQDFGVATIGGGYGNSAVDAATVAGGVYNSATGPGAFIGGGGYNAVYESVGNSASGLNATIGGGNQNVAGGFFSFVGGGATNRAGGSYSTIPGGAQNTAGGAYSFASGLQANAAHNNSFVWSDGSAATTSGGDGSVTFRASGGFRVLSDNAAVGAELQPGQTSWSTISDRNAKKNFRPADAPAILDKLAALPIEQWNYKWERDDAVPHLGPMAQDFKQAFYPGRDDKHISTLEFDGVELAAIQGLNQKLNERSASLEGQIKQKETEIQDLKSQNDALARRLSQLEEIVKQGLGH